MKFKDLLRKSRETGREYAEDARLQNEQRWLSFVQSIPHYVALIDSAGTVLFVNHHAEHFSEEEILGTKIFQHIEPESLEAFRKGVEECVASRSVQTLEQMALINRSGKRHYEAYIIPVIENNLPPKIFLVARDITERKQSEEQLQYQATLLANINDAIIASDASYRLTTWNASAESMYGWKAEEVLGKNGVEIIRTEWPAKDADEMRHSINETGCWRGEALQTRKDGTRFPVEVSTMVLHDRNGKISGYVSVNHDITDRKQAEDALRESEERFSKAFRVSPVGLNIFRLKDGISVDVNDAFLALTGYERDEIIGHSGAELNLFVDPDVRTKWMAGLREHGIVRNLEIQIRQKSGQIVYVLFSIARILANGQEMGLVLAIDITERIQAEEALREANKTLQLQLNEIQLLQESLREQAIRDPLTGLYNRRYLYEMLERETARAQRDHYPISVAMIDIDHFKDFNDKHGHQAGDEILMALGNLLLRSTRQGDIACRYGGEEFIIIMPEAQEDDAKRRADEICRDFANLRIDPVQADLAATLSIGIALYHQGEDDMIRVIKAADAALYQAKLAGRNRVQIWKGK